MRFLRQASPFTLPLVRLLFKQSAVVNWGKRPRSGGIGYSPVVSLDGVVQFWYIYNTIINNFLLVCGKNNNKSTDNENKGRLKKIKK